MQTVQSSKQLLTLDTTYISDFVRFATYEHTNSDLDAEYHVFEYLYRSMSTEEALWHSLLFVAYMHYGSVCKALQYVPTPAELPEALWRLPMDTERRAFRGGAIRYHIASLVHLYKQHGNSLENFLTQKFTSDPRHNWYVLGDTLTQIWGNGRWAAFKTREILYTANHFYIEPSNIENKGSSGPRQCLALFYPEIKGNSPMAISLLDEQTNRLKSMLLSHGVNFSYLDMETIFCVFHDLVAGRSYVGLGIDVNLGQLTLKYNGERTTLPPEHPAWAARKAVFAHKYLGELQGWDGEDSERKTLYKRTGKILDRDER
jgi:Alpha-glutamyl/putrescinyl thymine pyrophosphorylase clade 2